MRKIALFISALMLSFGCSVSAGKKNVYTTLIVQNNSKIDIFASIESKRFTEDFGVVVPGASAGIGFSPLMFGDNTIIHYSEKTIDENNKFIISTNEIAEFEGQIEEIIFRYLGNNQWVLVLLDTAGREVTFEKISKKKRK